jgi:TPR repeat protein
VEKLRKHGVLQACPLCRAALPDGPKKIYEDALIMHITLERKVESGKASWHTLTASQQNLMAEVVAMYTTAANQGHAAAQFDLGVLHHGGKGVSQDFQEAGRWFRKAAEQGHADAQYNLGVLHHGGKGVSQDFEEAVRWFQKALDQGHVNAQYNLGVLHHGGEGVSQDFQEAVRWFQKAADQGHAEAQEFLEDYFQRKKASASSTQCASCGRGCGTGVKLKPCSRCKAAFYCGEDCQRKHWKEGHKLSCTPKE